MVRLDGRELERAFLVLGAKLLGPDPLFRDRGSDRLDRQDLRTEPEEVVACHPVRVERLLQCIGTELRLQLRDGRVHLCLGSRDVVGVGVAGDREPQELAGERDPVARGVLTFPTGGVASTRGALEICQRLLQAGGLPEVRIVDVPVAHARHLGPARTTGSHHEGDQEHASGPGNGHG